MPNRSDKTMSRLELLGWMLKIVTAHISKNPVSAADLPTLIQSVFAALDGTGTVLKPKVVPGLQPAVPIRRSITPDYIVCLEDGRKLKMLKSHLRSSFGLTPDEYRRRWSLPPDYPMVAPNYAAFRREVAIKINLGHRRGKKTKIPPKVAA